MSDISKEFYSALGGKPVQLYARMNYDKRFVFLSIKDKNSESVESIFNFDEFKDLCQVFETLKDHLPEI